MRTSWTPSIVPPQYADDAFKVLVHILLDDETYNRDVYVVSCSTREAAEAKIRELYPAEARVKVFAAHLSAIETRDLKLLEGQFRPWADALSQT